MLLGHALQVRRAMAAGPDDAPDSARDRALARFLYENVEPGFVPRSTAVDLALDRIDAAILERTGGRETPFTRLVALLGLGPVEIDLLLCALAPAVRRGFREALQMIGPEVVPGGVHPAAHLIELVASSAETQAQARTAVEDDGALIAGGALLAQPMSAVAPPLWRALAPSPTLYRWLLGQRSPYPVLDAEPPLRRAVDPEVRAHLEAAVREAGQRPVRVLLLGETGSGRTRAAAALAHLLDRRAARLPAAPAELAPAALDARLRRRLLYLDAGAGDRAFPAAFAALAAAALDHPDVACAVATQPGAPAAAALLAAGFTRVDVPAPSQSAQIQAWQSALGPGADEDDIADLVRGHALPFHAIEEAATQAQVDTGLAPGADRAQGRRLLAAAERVARAHTGDRLSQIADRLSTTLTWDDLVLPDECRVAVDEIWRAAAARRTVYEDWGFESRTPYGRAISAIFSGPPGTGKTMVATLIARQLGIELYRVDLSRLVDKYIGETEKHLATLFGEAERGRCVLLFDEADAIFGKRTKSAESATDRYANLEVNYLLQRIETFSGIVLLTTNQETLVDEAFKRRLRYRVEFPFPDEDEREAIWRRLVPPEAPLAEDVDPPALARRYELSGGHIKNAVLRAAFAAAADDAAIDQARLIRAANQELENIGKLVMH